jgi:hypothetical protein
MTNTVLIKRSSVANTTPTAGDLDYGELAINYNDGTLYFKNTSNVVTTLASTQFVSVTGNVTGGNIITVGNVSATGNIAGDYFIGNGSQLTGITATQPVISGNLIIYSRVSNVEYMRIFIASGFLNIVGRSGNIDVPLAA